MDRVDAGAMGLALALAGLGFLVGALPAPAATVARPAPVGLGVAPARAPGPARPPPTPCPRRPGIAKPVDARVDPDLDRELVGAATPWPTGVDPRWTEARLSEILDGPDVVLHCEEWPCLLEMHAPDDTPKRTGDAIDGRAVKDELEAQGWEVGKVSTVVRPHTREDGRLEEVLVMPLRPAGLEPDPAGRLREDVRRFWILESL